MILLSNIIGKIGTVYESDVATTSTDWVLIASTATGEVLGGEYIISNNFAAPAIIEVGYGTNEVDPTFTAYKQSVVEDGVMTGNVKLGPLRGMYMRSDQIDTTARVEGIK